MKRIIFWLLLIFLICLAIELPFRFFDYAQERAFKKAQAELAIVPEREMPPLDDSGWRVIEDFEDIDFLKKTISDALRLNKEGNIILYPEYRLLKKAPYFTFKVNNMGFRGPDWTKRKDKNEVRVFVLGGSTAFSFFSDEERSIHHQLEQFLNDSKQDEDKQYRVYSAAMPGSNSFHELAVVRELIIKFNPDIVVTVNGFNDAGGNYSKNSTHMMEDKDTVTRFYRMLASLPNNAWVRHSSAMRYLADKLYIWSFPKLVAKKRASFIDPLKDAPQSYIENMIEMRDVLNEVDAQLLVYLQPSILVSSGKPLTKAEQRVHELWSTPGNIESYGRHLESYPLMLQFLQEKELHHIDGPSELRLASKGTSILTCTADGGEEVLKYSVDHAGWSIGYQGIAYASQDNHITFRFDSPTSIQGGRWVLFVSNYKDTNDVIAQAAISFDGVNYTAFPEKSAPFGYKKEIVWDWDKSIGTGKTVFLRASLPRGNYHYGLGEIQAILRGEQKDFQHKNVDPPCVETLQIVDGGGGIFIDAAHLNFKANAMLAQQVATYILDHNW